MTVRITKTSTTLQVDGRLDASNVQALRKVTEGMSGPVKLDLSNLLSADEEGIATILELSDLGAEVVGADPYFALLFDMKRSERKSGKKPVRFSALPYD